MLSKDVQSDSDSSEDEQIEYPDNLEMQEFRWELTEFIKIVAAIRTDDRLREPCDVVDSENRRD